MAESAWVLPCISGAERGFTCVCIENVNGAGCDTPLLWVVNIGGIFEADPDGKWEKESRLNWDDGN